MTNNFERVIGLPGEKVEWKNGTLYINGKEADKKYYPLKTSELGELSFNVPKDNYLVLITYSPQETLLSISPKGPKTLNEPGLRFDKSFFDACLVERKEIIGRAFCIYNPPERRKLLFSVNSEQLTIIN